jgi:hypothetical protein
MSTRGVMQRTHVQIGAYFTPSAAGALTQHIAALNPYLTEAFHLELMEARNGDGLRKLAASPNLRMALI